MLNNDDELNEIELLRKIYFIKQQHSSVNLNYKAVVGQNINHMTTDFSKRLEALQAAYQQLIARENKKELVGNGVFDRYQ